MNPTGLVLNLKTQVVTSPVLSLILCLDGDCDGSFDGQKYFDCEMNYGTFLKESDIADICHPDEMYEVESILEEKTVAHQQLYLVKWKNYPVDQATWEPTCHIHHTDVFKQFKLTKIQQ